MRESGISLSQDLQTKKPRICWWAVPGDIERRQKNLELSRAATTDFDPPRPEGLNYYPFQRAGIQFCLNQAGTYIGDDMGLGKTIQAIGFINCKPEIKRALIVTKASLKENWRRELETWLVRPLKVGIAEASRWARHVDIVIINYESLCRHFHSLHDEPWDLVVLDESQFLANRFTKRSIAVIGFKPTRKQLEEGKKELPRINATYRLALSGTPIENRVEDLWTVLHFLDPERWPTFHRFAAKFCGMRKMDWGLDTSGASNLGQLQQILRATVLIRRLKTQVLPELPPKTRQIIEVDTKGLEAVLDYDARQFTKHEEFLQTAQIELELARVDDDPAAFKAAVAKLADAKFAFTEISLVRHQTAVAKLPKVIPLLREDMAEAGKMLVFAHHQDVLSALHEEFNGESVLITGATPAHLRQGICDRFQNDARIGAFFGSTRACGEGLNLTAAKLVVFFEEDWVPSKLSQAEDRAHRIGQKDNVLVKHYILPGSTDARMIKTTLAKQAIIDQALDTPEAATEPVLCPYSSPGNRKDIIEEGLLLLEAQQRAVLEALTVFAGLCRGGAPEAVHPVDAGICIRLERRGKLTCAQVSLARRILRRYPTLAGKDRVAAMG